MKPGFGGIQGLRALAALAVAFLHIADEAGALAGTPGRPPYGFIARLPLEAGVDLFFVISGFVLVWSSWDAFGTPGAVRAFLLRRLLRVAPLYWLLTALTVAAALAMPGAVSDGLRDGWRYVAASALFWPVRRLDGFIQPVLRLGWTLEYEALFYALLACTLTLRRRAGLAALLALLAGLAAVGQAHAFTATPLLFWMDPVILEFGLGALAAVAARRGWRAGRAGLPLCLLAIQVAVLLAGQPGLDSRVLVCGLPAAAFVFCALSWNTVPGWLILLGDASYALYLVHPFPMRALRVLFAHLPLPPGALIPLYIVAAALTCVAIGVGLHRAVEQPILRWGKARLAA